MVSVYPCIFLSYNQLFLSPLSGTSRAQSQASIHPE